MGNGDFQFLSIHFWHGTEEFEPCFYPYCVEEAERDQAKPFRTAGQDFLIAALLLSGELQYEFGQEKIILRPGELLLIPPGTAYCFGTDANRPGYRKLVLEISGRNLEQELRTLNLIRPVHRKGVNSAELAVRIRELGSRMDEGAAHFAELVGRTTELLYTFRENRRKRTGGRFRRAQDVIETSLSEAVNVGHLAERLHIARSTLGRLFRQETGSSPREYWIRRKFHRACYYLSGTDLSIKEIAALLGYSSQFHFSGEFRKRSGLSPREYRKNEKIKYEKA